MQERDIQRAFRCACSVLPVILLSACKLTDKVPQASGQMHNASVVQAQILTREQKALTRSGVEQMIKRQFPETGVLKKLGEIRGFQREKLPNLQVCGEAYYLSVTKNTKASAPFYLEITQKADGTLEATRGQVGFDKIKLGKVRFMCR